MTGVTSSEAWEGDGQEPNEAITQFAKEWNEQIILGSASRFLALAGPQRPGLEKAGRSASNPDISSSQPHIRKDSDPHTPNSDSMAERYTPKGWSSKYPKGEYDMINGGRLPVGVKNTVTCCQIPPECINTLLENRRKRVANDATCESDYHLSRFSLLRGRSLSLSSTVPQHSSFASQHRYEHATLGEIADPAQFSADSVGTFRSGATEHDEYFSPPYTKPPHHGMDRAQLPVPFDPRRPAFVPYAPATGKNLVDQLHEKQIQLNYVENRYQLSQMRHQKNHADMQKMQKENIAGIKKTLHRGFRDQEAEHDKAVAALQKEHEVSKAKLQKKHDAESEKLRNDVNAVVRELSDLKRQMKLFCTPPMQQGQFQAIAAGPPNMVFPPQGQRQLHAKASFTPQDQQHGVAEPQAQLVRMGSNVEDRLDTHPNEHRIAHRPLKRALHVSTEEHPRPKSRGEVTPTLGADGHLTPTPPQQFNVAPNPHDDVFNGNPSPGEPRRAPHASQRKSISLLLSLAFKKVEGAVRALPIQLIDSKQKPQYRYVINAAQRLLTNQKLPYEFFRDTENRKYLMIGIISQEIVKEIFEDPILDKFASPHTETFCNAWQAELDVVTQGRAEDLAYRHALAEKRGRTAHAIAQTPGFWKQIQQYSYEVTERIAERVAGAFWPSHGDALREGLWKSIDECLRIAIRMRQEFYVTDFFFPKLGVSWNGDFMVHRNPETVGKDLDNDKAVHLVRITMLPLVKQKRGFAQNIADPTVLHRAEVLVDSRDSGLRVSRNC